MIDRWWMLFIISFFILYCTKSDDDGDPDAITGQLINAAENSLAAGAVVRLFDATTADRQPIAITVSDVQGKFAFTNLSQGLYRIWAENDSLVLYVDSLTIPSEPPLHIFDTLQCASSVSGVVIVEPHDNPTSVIITPLGTGKTFAVKDLDGNFLLSGLAPGTYATLFECVLPGYSTTRYELSVSQMSNITKIDTVKLTYTKIPVLTGIKIIQDTLEGTICLSWNKTQIPNFRDYVIYRDGCSAIDLSPEPFKETTDTFFVEQIYDNSRYFDFNDTIPQCLKYRVAIRTIENAVGSTNGYAQIKVVSPAMTRTYTYAKVTCEGKPFDSVSIDDTIVFKVFAKNRTRTLRSFKWFDQEQDRSLSGAKLPDSTVKEWSDSIRYAFHDTGVHPLHCIVTDDAGREWWDGVRIKTVLDTLKAIAGNDTGVFVGEKVHLHATAFHRFGTIPVWRWKIGNGNWGTASGPDSMFKAPDYETVTVCSLSITDEDGTTRFDALNVYTSFKVISTAAGANHTLILKADSTLWACGDNSFGQLGDGTIQTRFQPVPVMKGVRQMAAGKAHTLILKNDGMLYACGNNSNGQFGDGTTEGRLFPVPIMSDVNKIAAGSAFSLIIKNDASLWICGQLTMSPNSDSITAGQYLPVKIMSNVREIAAGNGHLLIVTADSALWTCGDNRYGQLGDDSRVSHFSPVKIMSGITTVAAGATHSLAVTSDGTVYGCGSNLKGELGSIRDGSLLSMITITSGILTIAAGDNFSLFLKQDHTLSGCGKNQYGQLADGSFTDRRDIIIINRDIKQAAAGARHSLQLKSDGSLWVCGDNVSGQLGTGSHSDHSISIRMIPYAFNP